MVPGEQGIATKESDMSEGPLSVYEWSKLDLGEHETYKWE